MSEPGRDAAFTTFPILRAVVHDFDHPGASKLRDVQNLLDELEARHGRDAVAACVHTLAILCLTGFRAAQGEEAEPLDRTIDGLEQQFLRQQYGDPWSDS